MEKSNCEKMVYFTKNEWDGLKKYNGLNLWLEWSEIPQNQIFCLNSLEAMENSKLYNHYLLQFTDYNGKYLEAYAPAHFVKQIRRNRGLYDKPYFVSRGFIELENGLKMEHFEIFYKQVKHGYEILKFH